MVIVSSYMNTIVFFKKKRRKYLFNFMIDKYTNWHWDTHTCADIKNGGVGVGQ